MGGFCWKKVEGGETIVLVLWGKGGRGRSFDRGLTGGIIKMGEWAWVDLGLGWFGPGFGFGYWIWF